jgi:holo-ACP synthase
MSCGRSSRWIDVNATVPPPSSAFVSLDDMLLRREARAARQRALLECYGRPVVSLTLVYPGPVKDTADARVVFEAGLAATASALARAGHAVVAGESAYLDTGPEALQVVDAEPLALKRILVALEQAHPLGRLWDADVIAVDGAGVSRRQLGLAARRCLICDQAAHACARGRVHALAEVQRAIRDRIDAYRDRQAS